MWKYFRQPFAAVATAMAAPLALSSGRAQDASQDNYVMRRFIDDMYAFRLPTGLFLSVPNTPVRDDRFFCPGNEEKNVCYQLAANQSANLNGKKVFRIPIAKNSTAILTKNDLRCPDQAPIRGSEVSGQDLEEIKTEILKGQVEFVPLPEKQIVTSGYNLDNGRKLFLIQRFNNASDRITNAYTTGGSDGDEFIGHATFNSGRVIWWYKNYDHSGDESKQATSDQDPFLNPPLIQAPSDQDPIEEVIAGWTSVNDGVGTLDAANRYITYPDNSKFIVRLPPTLINAKGQWSDVERIDLGPWRERLKRVGIPLEVDFENDGMYNICNLTLPETVQGQVDSLTRGTRDQNNISGFPDYPLIEHEDVHSNSEPRKANTQSGTPKNEDTRTASVKAGETPAQTLLFDQGLKAEPMRMDVSETPPVAPDASHSANAPLARPVLDALRSARAALSEARGQGVEAKNGIAAQVPTEPSVKTTAHESRTNAISELKRAREKLAAAPRIDSQPTEFANHEMQGRPNHQRSSSRHPGSFGGSEDTYARTSLPSEPKPVILPSLAIKMAANDQQNKMMLPQRSGPR
jgi:hypothetical protein